jgi:Flp pilus assembly protein TadD
VIALMPNYLLRNPDDSRARMFFAVALCDSGKREDAIREGKAAMDSSPGDSVMLYNGACLYAQLGETRRAIDTLRKAIAAGVQNYGWMKNDTDLDPLRGDPEFQELLEGK